MLTDTPTDSTAVPELASAPAAAPGLPTSTSTPSASRIPGEKDRPRFVVFDDWHDEGEVRLRPGVWHFGIKPGKGDAPPALTQRWVCSPLHLDAVTTDSNHGNYGRLLRIKSTMGRWTTWAMPMAMLRGDCSDLRGELLAMGVEIDPFNRVMLGVYLQDRAPQRRVQCALQTGWASTDYKAFVLPDSAIGPQAAGVIYQTEGRAAEEYTTAGTLAGWQEGTAALAVGNPLLVLARCGAESGGIHLIGDSSTGKTTAIEAACSVWGGPNFKRSWRTTANGLEGAASLFNDSLLALDEISECDPRAVGETIYMLGNGRGKQRAGRTGAARAVARWCSSVLSNGERSIATTMAEGGHRIKAGQTVRLLDVPVQRRHGAWDTLHQHASGTEFSDALKREAATHYGHAGRAFLEKLSRDHDTSFSAALDAIKAIAPLQGAGSQCARAAARFAVLALAGELAITYGVAPWPEGSAIEAAAVGFAAWQSLRGADKGNAERGQIAERINSFLERHGDSRFTDADTDDEQRALLVRDRAGWWRETSDKGRVYLFTSDGLREALKGFDFNRALDTLQELGFLEAPSADGKRAKSMRIHGRVMKLYAVSPGHEEDV